MLKENQKRKRQIMSNWSGKRKKNEDWRKNYMSIESKITGKEEPENIF